MLYDTTDLEPAARIRDLFFGACSAKTNTWREIGVAGLCGKLDVNVSVEAERYRPVSIEALRWPDTVVSPSEMHCQQRFVEQRNLHRPLQS